MEVKTYGLNYSQDVIYLQTKYALFSRVANILFSTVVEGGFDNELMTKAVDLLFQRNDCLRITFVKKDGKLCQYFVPERHVGKIPFKKFNTPEQEEAFIKRFRKKLVSPKKGETLKVVFAVNPAGQKEIFFKISHFSADSYGIGVLVTDLFKVYRALESGSEIPAAPGSFETILQKEMEYRADTSQVEKDREFFNEYYDKHKDTCPIYCGVHGANNKRWLKQKNKGERSLPYLFIKCDTEGYRFVIPSAITEKAGAWCLEHNITLSSFFYYCCCITTSLLNGREKYQLPLELLNCRGTIADKKAAGTKVQSISIFATVDYDKSFNENITEAFEDQNELYRHTKLSYLEIEALQHKLWNFSMLRFILNFCFSFIPFSNPDGVSMNIHSNGKGALVCYMALMHNIDTNEIFINYDVQSKMVTARQLIDFQNAYVHVIETVLADNESKLKDLAL